MAGAIAAALLGMTACAIVPTNTVAVSTPHLRVADVASLSCLEDRSRARVGDLALAQMPEGQRRLSRAALRSLLVRRVPELAAISLGGAASEDITFERPRARASGTICYRSVRAVSAGDAITANSVEATSCQAATAARLHYDQANARLSSSSDLAAGAYLGRIEPQSPAPDTGEPLTFDVIVGPVRIMRQVTALQPGARSQRLFVRDDDGHRFRVPLSRATP